MGVVRASKEVMLRSVFLGSWKSEVGAGNDTHPGVTPELSMFQCNKLENQDVASSTSSSQVSHC